MGTTGDVAAWVAGTSIDAMPADVLARGRAAIVDTVGVTIAGVAEPVARIAAELIAEDGSAPVASQLGTSLLTSPESAALLNGIAGHALDYDDVNASVTGHPSVVVLPAAFAAAELTGASGAALLEGYVIGVEVMAKLGRAMGPEHYRVGWHATSTLGTIGAAVAAGKLLGLDERRLRHAIAIAVSEASGSRQNFGTMTKPFHAGHAARCGVTAARLAGRGLTGDENALEAPCGFFALFSHGAGQTAGVGSWLGAPYELASVGLSVKQYPCCYATHRAADAVLALRSAHGLDGRGVEAIEAVVPVGAVQPLIHPRPASGLEGKFSMQYVLAAALLDGRLGLDSFSDAAVARPEARDLLARVSVHEDPAIATRGHPIDEGHVEVSVRLRDGTRLRRRVERPRGSPELPLTQEELSAKFRDCVNAALEPDRADQALAALWALERQPDVRSLAAAMRPVAGAVR
jgi:2-methylcitrate dehydratase PrpD